MPNDTLINRRFKVLGSASPLFYDEPLEVVKGEGAWLFDASGRRYLDAYNNVPCVGHCHPRIVEAMYQQARELNVHTRYLNERIVGYAENLVATFNGDLDGAMFTCTGSEANELALRMARFLTGKRGLIVSDCNYHGNTTTLAEVTTLMPTSEPFNPDARAVSIPCLYQASASEAEVEQAFLAQVSEAIASLQASGAGVAALLIDSLFANEGIPRLPKGALDKAIALVKAAGGMVVIDEVQSGFARTGENMWGYQAHAFKPDFVTLGKPMGNGFPLAGVITQVDYIERFGKANMYFNTFGGSPVAAAVGQAVLDVIREEKLQQNALLQGENLHREFTRLAEQHSIIGDIRGKGLFFAVELVQDRVSKTPATAEARQLVNRMRQDGVLISKIGVHDNVLKIRPPLPFNLDQATLLVETFEHALRTL